MVKTWKIHRSWPVIAYNATFYPGTTREKPQLLINNYAIIIFSSTFLDLFLRLPVVCNSWKVWWCVVCLTWLAKCFNTIDRLLVGVLSQYKDGFGGGYCIPCTYYNMINWLVIWHLQIASESFAIHVCHCCEIYCLIFESEESLNHLHKAAILGHTNIVFQGSHSFLF